MFLTRHNGRGTNATDVTARRILSVVNTALNINKCTRRDTFVTLLTFYKSSSTKRETRSCYTVCKWY